MRALRHSIYRDYRPDISCTEGHSGGVFIFYLCAMVFFNGALLRSKECPLLRDTLLFPPHRSHTAILYQHRKYFPEPVVRHFNAHRVLSLLLCRCRRIPYRVRCAVGAAAVPERMPFRFLGRSGSILLLFLRNNSFGVFPHMAYCPDENRGAKMSVGFLILFDRGLAPSPLL